MDVNDTAVQQLCSVSRMTVGTDLSRTARVPSALTCEVVRPLGRKYGYSEEASKDAPRKMGEVVKLIDERLAAQEAKGSKYLVGDSISAVDIYWATISTIVIPAGPEIMARTKQNEGMLKMFAGVSMVPQISEAVSERMEKHRDYILHTYCETPAVLGGDPL